MSKLSISLVTSFIVIALRKIEFRLLSGKYESKFLKLVGIFKLNLALG